MTLVIDAANGNNKAGLIKIKPALYRRCLLI